VTATEAVSQFNLAAVHEAVSARIPDRPCVLFRDRHLTFADITARSRRLAHVLHGRGLGRQPDVAGVQSRHESPHDHLAIYAHNGNEYLESMLGAFKARVAPVNINYRYVADELEYVLQNSGAKAIVFHSAFAATLAAVLPKLPGLNVLLQVADESGHGLLPGAQWYEDAIAASSAALPSWASEWSPDDLYVLFTGGTTGMPKGVLWRHADVHRSSMGGRMPGSRAPWPSLDALVDNADAATGNVLCPTAPFMHGAGHWVAFMAMNLGWTVAIQDVVTKLDPGDVCRTIDRHKVTYLQLVGDAFARPILDEAEGASYDLSSLRTVLSGGAALSPTQKSRFIRLIPGVTVIDSIGSSEGGGQAIQITTAADNSDTSATFTPSTGSVVVNDERSRLLSPGDDDIGWLAKCGTDIPIGYLGDADKTAQTFPIIEGERMSVPGDRARWLADGSIELLGREAATINSGGEKIFAEEVEAALRDHPDVYDAVVTSRPSERWGQEVVAIVQLTPGAGTSETELNDVAARRIARYKLPKMYVFVPSIERSPSGKADYRWAKSVASS
jgi:3-oxocholest-4-en-26-oate---CoA ligase